MSSLPALSYRRHPWAYFSLFLAANFLLSYSPIPLQVKVLIGILGIILPLYTALRTLAPPNPGEKPLYLKEGSLSPPLWLLFPACVLILFIHFYRFSTLFAWPNLDEGWIGTIALELSKHWTWKFFYTFGEAPPLTVWCVAVLFKLGFSPTVSLWLPPVFCSLLTVVTAFFASRRFFSRSFSWILGGLFAFSSWPLLLGRLCHQGIWLPLWVCLCVLLLGFFQKAGSKTEKIAWALGLGFGLGLGSFVFTPWPVVTGLMGLGLFWNWVIRPGKNRIHFALLTLALAISVAPFCLALLREGYGSHLASLSPWGGWFQPLHALTNFLSYFTVFFWGVFDPEPAYTPIMGGFLDPLLGAFFFVGILELFRFRGTTLVKWVMGAFLLFLLPGVLSLNVETFRTAQVLPLLLFVTATGFLSLLETCPEPKRLRLFVLLLVLVGSLDYYLLTSPYMDPNDHPENFGRPVRSLERYRAYELLEELQRSNGPGLVLASFETDSFNDPTLSLMTYPFNAAGNPALLHSIAQKKEPPKWAAVFVNNHYQPFLQKRFPEGKWYSVSKDLGSNDGGYLLGIIPVTLGNYQTLFSWMAAHVVFESADLQRFFQSGGSIQTSLRILEASRPLTKNDPFLEALYWDKRAAYEYVGLDYDQQLYSYQMAVKEGYPTADLYFKLGELLRVKGRLTEAQGAYLRATQAPLDLTPSAQLWAALKSQTQPKK